METFSKLELHALFQKTIKMGKIKGAKSICSVEWGSQTTVVLKQTASAKFTNSTGIFSVVTFQVELY